MARKILIDCDPGIDDALALTLALFDPRLEVVAVTAVEGNVCAEQATKNVQTVIEQLDPPKFPRVGVASHADAGPGIDARHMHGPHGLGTAEFAVASLHRQHPSDKIICEEVHQAPGEVSVLCLGPLTNVARALQRDPGIVAHIHRLVIMGGTLNGEGNVTPCAEFNVFSDPMAAKRVFRAAIPKTVVPLETSSKVPFDFGFLQKLPSVHSRAGNLLQKIVPHLFRGYRQQFGLETIHLHDVVALMALLHPELFEMREWDADVETEATITTGMTIFDRRPTAPRHANLEVAVSVNAPGVVDAVLRGLAAAEQATS